MDLEIKKGKDRFYIGESEDNDIARITYFYKEENVILAMSLSSDSPI